MSSRARATANATRALASALASTSASTSIAREGASELGRVLAPGPRWRTGRALALARGRAYASEAASVASAVSSASRVALGSTLAPTWKAPGSARELAAVCYGLSKFRLSAFVVSTTAAGFALGSPENIDLEKMFYACAGTMMCSASANTLNQVIERVPDGLMRRTAGRPMPSGRCGMGFALTFAGACAVGGVGTLAVTTNETTAALGAGNIALYAGAYTALKRVHFLNTWVGAIVGAIPPLMGWAAANETGALDPGAYVLGAALYLWQMPHFMALAYMGKDDYFNGGYRMLSHPMYDKTGRRVAGVALRNSLALLPLGLAACAMGVTTTPFAYETLALGVPLVGTAAAFYASPSFPAARRMFFGSLLYLPAFQALACLHRIPRDESVNAYESLRRVSVNFPWHCVPFAAGNDWTPERERLRQFRSRALGPALSETSVAPFPLLPLPIPSCPHDRAYAASEDSKSRRRF